MRRFAICRPRASPGSPSRAGRTDRVRHAQIGRRITYSFANVPPGEYWLAPVADVEPGDWFDPTFLQRLEPTAIKETVGEGEQKTQDLRVGGG